MAGRNAAQRVIALIARVDAGPPGHVSMNEGLNHVFEYKPVDPEREHVRRLEAWRGQIDQVRSQLRRMNFPEPLYARWLSHLEAPLRPTALAQNFEHLRSQLSEGVRLCLAWCAYALEDEGGDGDSDAARQLAQQLRDLLASEAIGSLPDSVRHIYSTHLQAVLDALDLAGIDGSESLRKAAKAAAVDIVLHADEIDEATTAGSQDSRGFVRQAGDAIGKAFDLAKKGGDAADGIEKIRRLAEAQGPRAVALIGWAVDKLT